jgi:hypothetical protein
VSSNSCVRVPLPGPVNLNFTKLGMNSIPQDSMMFHTRVTSDVVATLTQPAALVARTQQIYVVINLGRQNVRNMAAQYVL